MTNKESVEIGIALNKYIGDSLTQYINSLKETKMIDLTKPLETIEGKAVKLLHVHKNGDLTSLIVQDDCIISHYRNGVPLSKGLGDNYNLRNVEEKEVGYFAVCKMQAYTHVHAKLQDIKELVKMCGYIDPRYFRITRNLVTNKVDIEEVKE